MARDPDAPVRICATTARSRYGLRDSDLCRIHCTLYTNPHYRSAAPMRLYVEEDVQELADVIASEREAARLRAEADAPLIAARKAEEARAAKVDAAEALREYESVADVPDFVDFVDSASVTCLSLPRDVLEAVAICLGRSVEPDGVRGPGIAARDLCAMTLACRELRVAARAGFAALAARCGHVLDAGEADKWSAFLRRPSSLRLPDLKDLARDRCELVSGTKAEVAMRVLHGVDVFHRPSAHASPAAVIAVSSERFCRTAPAALMAILRRAHQTELVTFAGACLDRLRKDSLAGMRCYISKTYRTLAELNTAVEGAKRLHYPESPRVRPVFQRLSQVVNVHDCTCGQAAARDCSKGLCRSCCVAMPGACTRHLVR